MSAQQADSVATGFERAVELHSSGRSEPARNAFEALLPRLYKQTDGARLTKALTALSAIERAAGNYDKAISRANEALEVSGQAQHRLAEAEALRQRAIAEDYKGEYAGALESNREALATYRALKHAEGEISILLNIGIIYYSQGRYFDALDPYQTAIQRVDDTAGEPWNPRLRQIATVNLATLFQRLGRYEQALRLYLRLRENPLDLTPREEAQLWANMGVLYRRMGDPIKAFEHYRRAQQLFAREKQSFGEIGVLTNIGILQALDLADYPKALASFSNVLRLAGQTSNQRKVMQAHLYRGEVLRRMGRLDSAGADFESAQSLAQRLGTAEENWKALYGLGRVAASQGKIERAAESFQRAIEIIESVRGRLQIPSLKSRFLADKRDVYDALITLRLKQASRSAPPSAERLPPEAAAVIFSLLERSREQSFQDRLRERLSRKSGSTDPHLRRLADLRSQMADLWTRHLEDPAGAADLLPKLQRLEDEFLSAETRYRKSHSDLPLSSSLRRRSLDDVQAGLDRSTAIWAVWAGRGRLATLWITHGRIELRSKPFESRVENLIAKFIEQTSEPNGDGWMTPSFELGRYLFEGFDSSRDPDIRNLAIIADSALQQAPFEALTLPQGAKDPARGPLLIERFNVFYLPTASSPLRTRRPSLLAPWQQPLAAFANPQPAQDSASAAQRIRTGWEPLPYAEYEARSIAEALGGRSQIYTGPRARKDRLTGSPARFPPILHFATHAAVDGEAPEQSRILLAPGKLAGAWDYLYLDEVYDLDLREVDLVTLSACETERGEVVRGEGIQAFSRAFLAAGAESVVTTLWRVSDRPAAELMKQFYYFLSSGKSRAASLREAKLRFLRSGGPLRHPYYWAGFVMTGDGLSPVPTVVSWAQLLLGAAFAAFLLGWIVRKRKLSSRF